MNEFKVSFCTTCMGRLHHLRKTLPKNIEDNHDYHNTEFVILDYNSGDNLEAWIKESFTEQIRTGKIVYAKVSGPMYFHRSHAKNVAAKCSSGDIICNLDADNFTGRSFANYLNGIFVTHKNIFLNTDIHRSPKDVCGRLALKRDDFFAVNGYDEDMGGWGYEDADLKERLTRSGLQYLPIDTSYLQFLAHDDLERMLHEEMFHKIEHVWVKYLGKGETETVYLLKDGTFQLGTIRKRQADEPYAFWVLQEDTWLKGNFILANEASQIILIEEDGQPIRKLARSGRMCTDTTVAYNLYQALSGIELRMAKHAYSIINNYNLMQQNQNGSTAKQNLFENNQVFVNFSSTATIV